jgi:hypothetical protein
MKAMKLRCLNPFLVTLTISLGVILPNAQSGHAETTGDMRFFCAKSLNPQTGKAVPTTMAKTKRGNVAMIRWQSTFFSNAGKAFTPLDRCQEVSRRFQAYYQDGVLAYLTTGKMNAQNVICVSDEYGGPCQGLLLTLEPKDNPEQVLKELLNVRARARGAITRGNGSSYVDVQEFLDSAPVETDTPTTAPSSMRAPRKVLSKQS